MTDNQRERIIAALQENPAMGNKVAFAAAGLRRTKAEIAAELAADENLADAIDQARGHEPAKVIHTVWQIATDKDHPSALRAALAILGREDASWRAKVDVEHAGSLEVANPDVAAAIERFTASVVQLANRGRAELEAGGTSS